jgi:small subunit ribosomal protein S6e
MLQVHPKRLGPKRATKIRRFFGLSKEDDVSALSTEALLLFASQQKPSMAAG